MYRKERADGSVMGGAMYYLSDGLREQGMAGLGKVLAIMFAILCIGGSIAGGNSFQVNQSLGALSEVIPLFERDPVSNDPTNGWIYGLVMTFGVETRSYSGTKALSRETRAVRGAGTTRGSMFVSTNTAAHKITHGLGNVRFPKTDGR